MTDITEEGALRYVVDLAPAAKTILSDTTEVFDKPVYRAPHPLVEPLPEPLKLLTLRSLAQYAAGGGESVLPEAWHFLHVEAQRVRFLSTLSDFHRKREVLAEATFTPAVAQYINTWIPLEDAIIGLLAEFDQSGDRDAVIAALKAVKREDTEIHEDDGIGQQVTARAGVQLVTMLAVPNPVKLAPFRTFPEVAQPLSLFALRLKDGPMVLLKQADGAQWMVEAAANIGAFLTNAMKSSGTEGALPQVIF
jgi:hypothetical protein